MGLFDIVTFVCPKCKKLTSEQTKVGRCLLGDFHEDAIPVEIAMYFQDTQHTCEHCNTKCIIRTKYPIVANIPMYLEEDD